jgi:hypothetical protein
MNQDIRDFLSDMATEVQPRPSMPPETHRRAGHRRVRTATVGALALALLGYSSVASVRALTGRTYPIPGASILTPHPASPEPCSWSVVPTPNQDPTKYFNQIESVEVVSDSDVWALSTYYAAQKGGPSAQVFLHWDGSQWTTTPLPAVGTDLHVSDLAAVSSDDAWAVGYFDDESGGPNVLTLHWDGTAWANVPAPGTDKRFNSFTAVAATASNDVWAVGNWATGSAGGTLVEHWDGDAWTIVPSPDSDPEPLIGASYSWLSGVAALATNDVWAVGSAQNVSPAGPSNTLVEHWDGTAWTIVPSPDVPADTGDAYDHLSSVAAASPNDIWAVGDYGVKVVEWHAVPQHALIEHWDGTEWTVAQSPPVEGQKVVRYGDWARVGAFFAVAAVSSDEVWAAGTTGDPTAPDALIELWDGTGWTQVESPIAGASLFNAAVGPNGDVWAVGSVMTDPATVETLALRCVRSG